MATQTPVTEVLDLTVQKAPRHHWLEVLHGWVTTVDHKRIGLMYIGYALIFLVIAGFEALLMRVQLAIPNNHFVSPEVFNRLFTMHGTTMVFFVGMPILFGFGNYLIPLMIGARDMAFPRLNAFSFWISAFGGLLLYFSYFGGSGLYGAGSAPNVGWFAYAPLTARVFSPGHSTDYWTLALLLSGIGTIGTALNIVATTICMRCPGMKMSRLPLLVWLYLVTAFMVGRTFLTRRRADPRCCGCTSSGSLDIRRCISWCCRRSHLRMRLFPCFRARQFSDIRRWSRLRWELDSSA
jgi:cytochrome c oxidase subunit 1